MKKVMRLVSVQIWAILGSMFTIGENKKKNTKALYSGFAIFTILMSILSFFYAYTLGSTLIIYGGIEILPTLFMAITSIVVLITTINKVKGTVFGFKDYDMVMSLPLSNGQIVASRLILLYSINFVFVLIIMIPMTIAYGILVRQGFLFYVYSIVITFFIPLIPIVIASIIGTILTYVTMSFRYSNVVYMILVFLFLIASMIMPFFIQDSDEAFAVFNRDISGQINRFYPLANMYSKAVTRLDLLSFISFMAVSILTFLLFSLVIGKIFKKVNTGIMTGRYKANYKLGELKSSSRLMALYKKELKRYFSSPIYVINTGFGVVLLLLFALALPFVNLETIIGEVQITGSLQNYIPVVIIFCIATSCTTMASISIEGKNLWILKSLPVPVSLIFTSKILVNLTILAPAILATVLLGITLHIPLISSLLNVIVAVSFAIFVSVFGLVINLNYPNLTWSNETVVIKQSTSAMITTLSGMVLAALQYGLLVLTGSMQISIAIFICLIWPVNFILYKHLAGKGIRQFERL